MSLLGRLTFRYSRYSIQSFYRKDWSNFVILRAGPFRRQDVRSFLTKREMVQQQSAPKQPGSSLHRYFVYTGVMVPTTFLGCMIWQYESLRNLSQRFHRMMSSQAQKKGNFRNTFNAMWHSLSGGQRMVLGILSTNVVIFMCWRVPRLHRVFTKYFQCMPGNPASSMTLSAFSHIEVWHILANMYVLWSFAPLALSIFGKEQFLAVYLSAATVSALTSTIYKSFRGVKVPSLGASGAILAILATACYTVPDSRVAIAFVDQIIPHSFSAKSALIGIIMFDILGILLRWKMFDHAAHLGGTLFGLAYIRYGKELTWDRLRRKVTKRWHAIRKNS